MAIRDFSRGPLRAADEPFFPWGGGIRSLNVAGPCADLGSLTRAEPARVRHFTGVLLLRCTKPRKKINIKCIHLPGDTRMWSHRNRNWKSGLRPKAERSCWKFLNNEMFEGLKKHIFAGTLSRPLGNQADFPTGKTKRPGAAGPSK